MMIKHNWQGITFNALAIWMVLACFFLPLAGCSSGEKADEAKMGIIKSETNTEGRVEVVSAHPSFVTQQELKAVLANQPEKSTFPEGRIVSAVMPHHLVAGRLLVIAMETLAHQEPDLVILVGPNHFNRGGKIITGFSAWQTPEGIVYTEEGAVSRLLAKGLAVRDEEVLSREHSVGALVPLLKHYLPQTRIIPVILHHDVSLQEVDDLLNGLEPYLKEKTVLISSVDFSHYLTRSEAQVKDRDTLSYMQNFDYSTLFHLDNDYLDSPAALSAAFRLAEKNGLREFSVLDNTNSGIILRNDFMETTSYFTLVFVERDLK